VELNEGNVSQDLSENALIQRTVCMCAHGTAWCLGGGLDSRLLPDDRRQAGWASKLLSKLLSWVGCAFCVCPVHRASQELNM
jgi:hypothetical protein